MSAGNHAQGVAFHAQRLGLRAVIVMPRFTPGVKVERTRGFCAEVILHGETLDEARNYAVDMAEREQLTFVHPYDDEAIVAGQGTVAIEMLREVPDLDSLIIAVGGGGLIAGMATVAKALRPQIEVVGVQTARFPAMVNAIKGTSYPQGSSSIAEGKGTTHMTIVDRDGNTVVMTTTIESSMGSFRFTNGFLLNNQLTDFSVLPSDATGIISNRIQGNKRPRSSMAPTLVFKMNADGTMGDFLMGTGSPGGSTIIQYVTKTVVGDLAALVDESLPGWVDANVDFATAWDAMMPPSSRRLPQTAVEL